MGIIKVNNSYDRKENNSISLREAVAYVEGNLKKEELTPMQLQQIDEDEEQDKYHILLCQNTTLAEKLTIHDCPSGVSVMIDGNGHTITGEADNDGFLVKSSNVTFQNVHFRNFKIAIFLASEKDLSDVGIDV